MNALQFCLAALCLCCEVHLRLCEDTVSLSRGSSVLQVRTVCLPQLSLAASAFVFCVSQGYFYPYCGHCSLEYIPLFCKCMFLINDIFNLFWCLVAFVNIRQSCHPYGVWIWQFRQLSPTILDLSWTVSCRCYLKLTMVARELMSNWPSIVCLHNTLPLHNWANWFPIVSLSWSHTLMIVFFSNFFVVY